MESSTNGKEDEFKVTCSDEEVSADFKEHYSGWEPKPESILWLYETIARDKTIPLKWTWKYGKRSPSPSDHESDEEMEDEEEKVNITGFDFDDEPTTPKLTPRRTPGSQTPKGSAKKRTTNFENILASVRRQQKMEVKKHQHKSSKAPK